LWTSLRHFEKKLHIAESKLEISCNIIDDFRHQYELSLDEIYDLQGKIDELVDECCQQKHIILTLNSKLSQIQKKYKTQSEKIDQILQRYNYYEFRKYQKRESYHTNVISEQKAEIKKLKLDTQKLETVKSEYSVFLLTAFINKFIYFTLKIVNFVKREFILMSEIVNNIA
jgi:chromosome segregation ATPase